MAHFIFHARRRLLPVAVALTCGVVMAAAQGTGKAGSTEPAQQWTLAKSTITYHATDTLHPVNGTTHAARGLGNCAKGQCSFLAAAPVKSFKSGDTNRDLHMLQSVGGGQFPMVTVRAVVPQSALKPGPLAANLQIQFGGATHTYTGVDFKVTADGAGLELAGTIPMKLTDFKITPPEFLFLRVKNSVPVQVDMDWQPKG